ncbi:MAG: Rnase Y domain-containing protein [Ignavibacteriales bacterium]|nr:Rnase Y domain-containing protein [Ignavibacteriales bacterium]
MLLLLCSFTLGWMMNSRIGKKSIITAEEQAKKILEDADKDAKNIKREKLLRSKR